MKKILLSISSFIFLGLITEIKAQCDLQFNNLQVVAAAPPVPVSPTSCQVVFNASFDIITNSGFKSLFFHSWRMDDYPNPPIFNCGGNTPAVDPGTAAQLGTSRNQPGVSFLDFGFIGLKDITDTLTEGVTINVTSMLATEYPHDPTVELTNSSNSPGMTASLTKDGDTLHFVLTNVTVLINQTCGTPLGVLTDIWGSNANAPDFKAQCYVCRQAIFFLDPRITGFINCNLPRQYAISIVTIDPVVQDIQYLVYVDMNGNGQINPGTDSLAFISDTISISAVGGPTPDSYSSGLVSLPAPYSTGALYINKSYLVTVRYVNDPNRRSTVGVLAAPQGCAPLPATFKSFTANRINRSNVALKWETLTEENVAGFAVERNINGRWEFITFVPSQALNGISNSVLAYQLSDPNSNKGISQYRIRQQDLIGTAKLSDIRSVRGEGQRGTTIVYPNPSPDGKVNVIFEGDLGKRNITVQDMSGRIIKQWNNYTNNNIQIENLAPGFYTIRVLNIETGSQVVEKVVVNNR